MRHCASAKTRQLTCSVLLALAGCCGIPSLALAQAVPDISQNLGLSGLVFGLLAGALLTASSYLVSIWLVFRHLSQMLLILMLLLLTAHMTLANQPMLALFGLAPFGGQQALEHMAMLGFLLVCIGFTINFLDLESHTPTLRNILLFLMGTLGVGIIAANIYWRNELHSFLPFVSGGTLFLLLLVGLSSWSRGLVGSQPHLLAFTLFLLGSLAVPLRDLHLVPLPALLAESMLYGSAALAALWFAAVISRQFTLQQASKERALQQSSERFSLAAQGANEGLYDWDVTNGKVYFSERLKRIVGRNLAPNRKGLREFWQLLEPQERNKFYQTLRQFRRGDKNALSGELRVKRPNGPSGWIFLTAVAIRDKKSRKITRMVGSVGDITAKKQSEYGMRLSEARFRSITEAHPVPVLIVKLANGNIMYASPGAEPLVKMSQSGLVGNSLHRLLGTETNGLLAQIAQDKRLDMVEATLSHPDSSTVPVAVSARVIDYQGSAAAVIGLYDLTERKRAEAQIAKQQEALQQSEKMAALGGLLAGVAHELNNPLSVIVGQATLLKESALDAKIVGRGEKIFTAAERCSRIVKSFLAIARRKPPEHRLMQLNEAVEQALELLTYQLRTENVRLQLELDPHLPEIIGDSDQFTQVVSNLVLNGTQALHDWKGARVITVTSRVDQAAGHVYLSVADSGPGVRPDFRARIFEPFFTTKAPGTGTGVGLSLCLNIVSAHVADSLTFWIHQAAARPSVSNSRCLNRAKHRMPRRRERRRLPNPANHAQ